MWGRVSAGRNSGTGHFGTVFDSQHYVGTRDEARLQSQLDAPRAPVKVSMLLLRRDQDKHHVLCKQLYLAPRTMLLLRQSTLARSGRPAEEYFRSDFAQTRIQTSQHTLRQRDRRHSRESNAAMNDFVTFVPSRPSLLPCPLPRALYKAQGSLAFQMLSLLGTLHIIFQLA